MVRTELRTALDAPVLDEILELIEAATRIEGHRPVGEHKYAHLSVGASGWAGALAYDGARLVGYAHIRWNAASDRPRAAVEIVVHPDYYGGDVASRLVTETRQLLARAGGGLLYLWVHRVQDPETTLAFKMGFAIQRELAFMSRELEQRPEAKPPPADIELRPYQPDRDDQALLNVNNAAFKGHPENGGWDEAELANRREWDWFDPQGLIMAWRGDRLLGFHWTKWHGHDSDEVPAHEPVGEVYVLAVHPDAQGMGLGRTLLDAGLAHLYDRGCRLAVLYVDCASTGAVRLYETAGFALQYREVCYEDWVTPLIDDPAADLRRPALE